MISQRQHCWPWMWLPYVLRAAKPSRLNWYFIAKLGDNFVSVSHNCTPQGFCLVFRAAPKIDFWRGSTSGSKKTLPRFLDGKCWYSEIYYIYICILIVQWWQHVEETFTAYLGRKNTGFNREFVTNTLIHVTLINMMQLEIEMIHFTHHASEIHNQPRVFLPFARPLPPRISWPWRSNWLYHQWFCHRCCLMYLMWQLATSNPPDKSANWKNILSVIDVDPQNSHEVCCFKLEFPTSAKKSAGFTQNSPR